MIFLRKIYGGFRVRNYATCYKRKLLFTVEEAFIPYSKIDKNDGLVPVDIEANWYNK